MNFLSPSKRGSARKHEHHNGVALLADWMKARKTQSAHGVAVVVRCCGGGGVGLWGHAHRLPSRHPKHRLLLRRLLLCLCHPSCTAAVFTLSQSLRLCHYQHPQTPQSLTCSTSRSRVLVPSVQTKFGSWPQCEVLIPRATPLTMVATATR